MIYQRMSKFKDFIFKCSALIFIFRWRNILWFLLIYLLPHTHTHIHNTQSVDIQTIRFVELLNWIKCSTYHRGKNRNKYVRVNSSIAWGVFILIISHWVRCDCTSWRYTTLFFIQLQRCYRSRSMFRWSVLMLWMLHFYFNWKGFILYFLCWLNRGCMIKYLLRDFNENRRYCLNFLINKEIWTIDRVYWNLIMKVSRQQLRQQVIINFKHRGKPLY